jgi:hypothetical protein
MKFKGKRPPGKTASNGGDEVDGMTAAWVENIGRKVLDIYEEKIASPRHLENQDRFRSIERSLDRANGVLDFLKWAIPVIIGIPAVLWATLQVIHFIKHG